MQETTGSKRIRFWEREHYSVDLEYNEEFLVLHLPSITKFNRKVFVDMVAGLDHFSDFFKTIGYENVFAAVDTNNVKIKKLLSRLGFLRIGIHGDNDVYRKEL